MKNTVSIIGVGDTIDIEVEASFDAVKKALDDAFVIPVRFPSGDVMLVDEDGDPRNLPFNERASRIAGQRLVGPVAFVQKHLVKKVLG
jgi:hypothetical protein